MSGGRLVVLDRLGRPGKQFPLQAGLATLGRDPGCDICVLQDGVSPHHATVVVHATQTVVRNVGSGETLVNGAPVSVAALRHGDVLTLGRRALRWEYAEPRRGPQHGPSPMVAVARRGGGGSGGGGGGGGGAGRSARRGGSLAAAPARDRAVQLALELRHRASMPGSTGGKQVAIVQPQRRDTNYQADTRPGRTSPAGASRRAAPGPPPSGARASPAPPPPARTAPALHTTQATLWIESRKTSPRKKARSSVPAKKSTPLRLTVLKRAQSAHRVIKIEAPLKIDHTKQAAIMLMTGHTPKSKLNISPQNRSNSKKSPSYVVKKPSPVPKASKGRRSGRRSKKNGSDIVVTPSRGCSFVQDTSNRRSSKRNSGNRSVLEITDSSQSSLGRASRRQPRSAAPPSPKKSAMKDHSKKSTRKTESIKFDLSNLESRHHSDDVLLVDDTTRYESGDGMSEEDLTLHYSESSEQSPSPRRAINSRSSRMLEGLGSTLTPTGTSRSTLTPDSPRGRKSIRGSMLVQRALDTSAVSDSTKARRSANATVASAFRTRTLSPRPSANLESYSVVDLVSLDSNDATKSVYDSADSSSTAAFGTPVVGGRKTRSTINPPLLGSSTPYVRGPRGSRSQSSSNITVNKSAISSVSTRRSKSLSTPENQQISVNNTRRSRASRSRSRINDSDLLLLDETEVEDSSPKTSKRVRTTKSVTKDAYNVNMTANSTVNQGISTPENRYSPEAAGTPVLSIQSLLDSSRSSLNSRGSGRRGKRSANYNRKTIGVLSEPKRRPDWKSKSLGSTVRKTLLRLSRDSGESSDKTDEGAPRPDNEEIVTPKSAVKISPEDVKNKHSSAKKPQSKRSIIDNLDRSDIVQQLFNSPVKRKLSQSMTEFSRKQLFDDEDDDIVQARRPKRNTVALTGRTPNSSVLERTEVITPERFVSPLDSPRSPPRGSRRAPGARPRRSIKNELTDVQGVKAVFAKSPLNRLSDVRVKEVFAVPPNDDLRRVSGVKALFQKNTSPKNDLTDVRGVRRMFQKKSPENDLRNVSGVKRILRNTTPKNDLTDVRGVRRMYRLQRQKENYHDVSGVEELFDESNQSATRSETLFDALVGKPTVRSVYSKTFSTKLTEKPKTRKGKSLHSATEVTTNNVEEWLELELRRRLHGDGEPSTSGGGASQPRNSSLGKRSASQVYSAHTLPIKKRSIAEASLEKGNHRLPIKKRQVVHSTPVKGRGGAPAAPELARVSPIAPHHTRSNSVIVDEEPRAAAAPARTRAPRKQETPKKIAVPPSRTPPPASEAPRRTARGRKPANVSAMNTKKRRNSVVITKKAPAMSTRAGARAPTTGEISFEASPRKTRAARGKKAVKVETPKRTRVRAARATVVVLRASPKLNPRSNRKAADEPQKEIPRGNRETVVAKAKVESPKLPPKNKNPTEKSKTGDKMSKAAPSPAKRARRAAPATRSGGRTSAADSSVLGNIKTRSRKPPASAESEPVTRRARVAKAERALEIKPDKIRGRKLEKAKSDETQTKTRSKRAARPTSVESEPTPRGRRNRPEEAVVPETRGRKRKGTAIERMPPKVARAGTGRGKKADASGTETTGKQKSAASTNGKVDNEEREAVRSTRATRSKRAVEVNKSVEKEAKPVRGRKAKAQNEKVAEPAKGKRKANVDASPAKGAKKPTPPLARGRPVREKPPIEAPAKAVGRPRRR